MISPFTYFPRVKPLNYDALALQVGCQPVTPLPARGFVGFVQFCSAEHDPTSSQFTKVPTIATCLGPSGSGVMGNFSTPWVVWLAKNGIRAAKNVLPEGIGENVGQKSSLFATETTTGLTVGFTHTALMAIAIEKTSTSIELAKFTANTPGAITRYTFDGHSPALWQVSLTHSSEDIEEAELVCFYLSNGDARVILCRFESEGFAIERAALLNLPAELASLIGAYEDRGRLILRAHDADGLDLTLHGAADGLAAHAAADLSLGFISGRHLITGQSFTLFPDKASFTIGFISGRCLERANLMEDLAEEAATLDVGFISGSHE